MSDRVRFARILAVLTVAVTLAAAPAMAQVKPGAPVFIVDASDNLNRTTVVSVQSFNEALYEAPPPGETWGTPFERVMSSCNSDAVRNMNAEQRAQRDQLLERLHNCIECLRAHQEGRYFTRRNDTVTLIVLVDARFDADVIRPSFRETARQSELVSTARALAKVSGLEAGGRNCRAFLYTLQRERSRVSVLVPDVALGPDVALAAAPAPPAGTSGGGAAAAGLVSARPATATAPARADVTTPEIIAGPPEHLFMSLDMSFEKSRFKLGSAPQANEERIKDKNFFAALNFGVGDLLVDRESTVQRRSFLKELVFKLQFTPSQEPWEAWAVGIGLRGYRLRTILWNLDVVHPYLTFGKLPDTTDPDQKHWRAVFGMGFDPRSLSR